VTEGTLYPLTAAMAEQLRTARYGLFEVGVSAELQAFESIADLARAIHAQRQGRGLEVFDRRALTWGEAPDETRRATDVVLTPKGGGAPVVLTVVLYAERAAQLFQALAATKPARAAA
jgi:hypothetical protein